MTIFLFCVIISYITLDTIYWKNRGKNMKKSDAIKFVKILKLRNIISHEYANIDYEIIWVVITKHLPPLKETVENIIKDLS